MAHEKERSGKLNPHKKLTKLSTNLVDVPDPMSQNEKALLEKKKRDSNFLAQIKELQIKSESQEKAFKTFREEQQQQYAEILSALSDNRSNDTEPRGAGSGLGRGGGNGGGGRCPQRFIKCKNCEDNRVWRCTHCWKCGVPATEHRAADCPNPPLN